MPVTIENGDILDHLQRILRITDRLKVPNYMPDFVYNSFQINDPLYYAQKGFVLAAEGVNAATTTVGTSSSTEDTYITCIQLSVSRDASGPSGSTSVTVNVNGVSRTLARLETVAPALTDYARSQDICVSLPVPLKVDKAAAITLINSSATAIVRASVVVYGFTVARL